jgi:hypothetical protein
MSAIRRALRENFTLNEDEFVVAMRSGQEVGLQLSLLVDFNASQHVVEFKILNRYTGIHDLFR